MFDVDHLPCRIPRFLNLTRVLIDPLGLQLDQRRRCHDGSKGILECPGVIAEIAMQRPGDIVAVEHALFRRDERQHLLRFLPDQRSIALQGLIIQPCPIDGHALPLHLRGMHAHMPGRR